MVLKKTVKRPEKAVAKPMVVTTSRIPREAEKLAIVRAMATIKDEGNPELRKKIPRPAPISVVVMDAESENDIPRSAANEKLRNTDITAKKGSGDGILRTPIDNLTLEPRRNKKSAEEKKEAQIKAGRMIRKRREEMHLSREEAASNLDLSVKFLCDLEYGEKGLSIDTLYKLMHYMNLSADDLIGREKKSESGKIEEAEDILKNILLPLDSCTTEQLMLFEEIAEYYADGIKAEKNVQEKKDGEKVFEEISRGKGMRKPNEFFKSK